MKWLALLAILLMPFSALAAAVTVDIYGTNISNAKTNLTQTGNNSYQIVQWAIGDTTKSLKADINGNASDAITFTIHNLTVGRVVEVKVNSSAYNSYHADSTGTISFTRTQTVKNQTYSFSPSINAGGYNFTWFQLWTWPSLFGVNFTQYFVPYSGATADLNMNNYNITNVQIMNITETNVTILNATTVKGNGTGITNFNASNATGALPNASIPLSAANLSKNNNVFTEILEISGSGGPPRFIVRNSLESGSELVDIDWLTGSGAAASTNTLALIRAKIMQADPDALQSELQFYTNQGDVVTQAMVLDKSGNVAIKRTTATSELDVNGTVNATNLQGNGTRLSSLNASNITIGSLSQSLLRRTIINVTANYTIGTSNSSGTMFTCYADSGTLNFTLPTGVAGQEFTVKKKDSSGNTCEIYSGQNIDGAIRANISVQYNSIDLVYTDEWSII